MIAGRQCACYVRKTRYPHYVVAASGSPFNRSASKMRRLPPQAPAPTAHKVIRSHG